MATLLILYLANIRLSLPYVVWVYGRWAVDVGLSRALSFRVSKRRLLELRRRGITQKKTHYIKNTAKA